MRQIMQKAIKKPFVRIPAILLIFCISLYLLGWILCAAITLILTGGLQGKTVVHKVMNYNQYNIVIISRASTDKWYFPIFREMYLEVWVDDEKTKSYILYAMDEDDIFSWRVKDVTLLPGSNEVKIEFVDDYGYSSDGKSRVGVGLYKIAEDQPNSLINYRNDENAIRNKINEPVCK